MLCRKSELLLPILALEITRQILVWSQLLKYQFIQDPNWQIHFYKEKMFQPIFTDGKIHRLNGSVIILFDNSVYEKYI